jgi:Zn-dependent protease with chaperone function
MDFYEHQERARKQTVRLIVLYALAVLGIVVLVYLAVTLLVVFAHYRDRAGVEPTKAAPDLWEPRLLLWIVGGTVLLVGAATLLKISELGAGGDVVAKALGGRRLDPSARNDTERKVLNVVEEMSIASGVPVLDVYLLDNESRINAFAAGFKPEHAVIGITRGAAELLSRDELQGVVAHEFSHILNGDMRLNIRLIGILHGILVIGLLGGMLTRAAFYAGGSSQRRGGGAIAMFALGASLFVIGYVGVFFGRLIKAAVSRQREFLADASAVDFTRQPDGIGGALKKIGGSSGAARLKSPKAPTCTSARAFARSGARSPHTRLWRSGSAGSSRAGTGSFPRSCRPAACASRSVRRRAPGPPFPGPSPFRAPRVWPPRWALSSPRAPWRRWAAPRRRTSTTPANSSIASRTGSRRRHTSRREPAPWRTRCCSIPMRPSARGSSSGWRDAATWRAGPASWRRSSRGAARRPASRCSIWRPRPCAS